MSFYNMVRFVLALLVFASPYVGVHECRAQGKWTKSVGIWAPLESRLVSDSRISLLYSSDDVFLSDNGGYIWWSIKNLFPNGMVAACAIQDRIIGLSIAADRTVRIHTSTDAGATWLWRAAFTLDPDQELVEISGYENALLAYTKQGVIYASSDIGETWKRLRITEPIGELLDVAQVGSIWVACGTEGGLWSADAGSTWHPARVPVQAGGQVTSVEAHNGKLWGGAIFGSVCFDFESMSWYLVSNGLNAATSALPTSIELKNLGGTLFGLFRDSKDANKCFRWDNDAWQPADKGGLPFGKQVQRFRFGMWRNFLMVFSNSTDPNMRGMYVIKHDVASEVNDANSESAQISPIPATDRLYVRTPNNSNMQVSIVDITGVRVFSTEVLAADVIDVSNLPTGTYQLILHSQSTTLTRPLVIQH